MIMPLRKVIFRGFLLLIGVIVAYHFWLLANVWWWIDHNPTNDCFYEYSASGITS
jgi:hypothetical protein